MPVRSIVKERKKFFLINSWYILHYDFPETDQFPWQRRHIGPIFVTLLKLATSFLKNVSPSTTKLPMTKLKKMESFRETVFSGRYNFFAY